MAVSSKRIVKGLAINVLPTALDRLEYRRENRKGRVTLHLEGADKRRSSHEVWRKSGTWIGLMLLLSVLTGCSVTESTFAKTASNAGSAFAAATTMTIFLLIAVGIGLIGIDPLQLALFASTVIALFLPISLSLFLILLNDPQYLGNKTNGRFTNIAVICILLMAFLVALVSLPLEIITGGG